MKKTAKSSNTGCCPKPDLKERPLLSPIQAGGLAAVFKVLSVENSVASRKTFGGTAPANVRREATKWLKQLAKKRSGKVRGR